MCCTDIDNTACRESVGIPKCSPQNTFASIDEAQPGIRHSWNSIDEWWPFLVFEPSFKNLEYCCFCYVCFCSFLHLHVFNWAGAESVMNNFKINFNHTNWTIQWPFPRWLLLLFAGVIKSRQSPECCNISSIVGHMRHWSQILGKSKPTRYYTLAVSS